MLQGWKNKIKRKHLKCSWVEIGQKCILTSNKILKITFGLSGRIFILMKWWLGAKLIISIFLTSLSKSSKEDRNGKLFPLSPSCQGGELRPWTSSFQPFRLLQELSIIMKYLWAGSKLWDWHLSGAPVSSRLARTHRALEPCGSWLYQPAMSILGPIKTNLSHLVWLFPLHPNTHNAFPVVVIESLFFLVFLLFIFLKFLSAWILGTKWNPQALTGFRHF